jgi:hypothetical protein
MAAATESIGRRRTTLLVATCAAVFALVAPGTSLAMLSRFGDQPMAIEPDGRSLVTEGPVEWEPDEARAIFFIVVRQGHVIATGLRQQRPPSSTWQVLTHVRGPGQLVPGPAEGFGTALVLRADGSLTTRVWSATIVLQ